MERVWMDVGLLQKKGCFGIRWNGALGDVVCIDGLWYV